MFITSQLRGIVLLHQRCLLHKILEVLLKDTVYRKVSFPNKESDTKLLQSEYFANEVISSYSNRIGYRKIAKGRTKDAWELHATHRTVFENHCSTSITTPASYDVTVLAIITP